MNYFSIIGFFVFMIAIVSFFTTFSGIINYWDVFSNELKIIYSIALVVELVVMFFIVNKVKEGNI